MTTPSTEWPAAGRQCQVTGCTRPASRTPWCGLCDRHAARVRFNGSTRSIPLRPLLPKYRKRIIKALDKYACSKATSAAVMLADDLLSYRPRTDFTVYHSIAANMQRLRDEGVTARELLQRVCEVWAAQAFDQHFENEKELTYSLARGVLMLRPKVGTWRPGGPLLRYLGAELLETLGKFAAGVCWRIEQDDETRAGARKAFDSWALRGEPDAVG